jgi:hypothetical protein
MLAATAIAIFIIPMLFVVIERLSGARSPADSPATPEGGDTSPPAGHGQPGAYPEPFHARAPD